MHSMIRASSMHSINIITSSYAYCAYSYSSNIMDNCITMVNHYHTTGCPKAATDVP